MVIPIFTSDYSIGRSILKIKSSKDSDDGGPDSIFEIAKENNLKEVYIVEDNMIGFLETFKIFDNTDIILHYGVRFNICNDSSEEESNSMHKVIVFARNADGCKKLFNLFSDVFCNHGGVMDYKLLKSHWDDDCLLLVHPFYDSYLFHNTFYFKNCMPEKISDHELYFIENNHLPEDFILSPKVIGVVAERETSAVCVKSIFYKNRCDFPAYQTYRMICGRKVGQKAATLSAPNINGLASDEFCFESYLEANG